MQLLVQLHEIFSLVYMSLKAGSHLYTCIGTCVSSPQANYIWYRGMVCFVSVEAYTLLNNEWSKAKLDHPVYHTPHSRKLLYFVQTCTLCVFWTLCCIIIIVNLFKTQGQLLLLLLYCAFVQVQVAGQPELNFNNSSEVLSRAVQVRKRQFLRTFFTQMKSSS